MNINGVKNYSDLLINNSAYINQQKSGTSPSVPLAKNVSLSNYSSSHLKANYMPVSFKGNAPQIKNAYIITSHTDDIPLQITKENNSYLIDFDSQTEIIYGTDAIAYLNSHNEIPYDTQVIVPKKAQGTMHIDGKDVDLPENSGVLINAGTKAKIDISKGYPMVIFSKKDYDWYERYGRDAQDINIRNKFLELMYFNSHLYNGEFTPNTFLSDKLTDESFLKTLSIDKWKAKNNLVNEIYAKKDELEDADRQEIEYVKGLLDKLFDKGLIKKGADGYLRFERLYVEHYMEKLLGENGFTKEEIDHIMPMYSQARQVHMDSLFSVENTAEKYPEELVAKMKETGLLHKNTKNTEKIYWKEFFGNEKTLRKTLEEKGFTPEEQEIIVTNWQSENRTGFDLSGLKFINESAAVYNLNDKLNNWTHEKTNWVSNSTAPQSIDGKTPFVGISMVQTDEKKTFPMSALRKGEQLHTHPNLDEKRQTEIYMITSGSAALNIVKNGKSCIKILKEGDLAVVDPGVAHCVNSVHGEYEHIVAQVPSAFQYGFGFKMSIKPPEDYDEERLQKEAFEALENTEN